MFQTVKGWLRTEGRIFVNEDGREVILRGMGIGNWLNPEGFLMGASSSFHFDPTRFSRSSGFDRGRTLDMFVTELCGKTYQKKFWDTWVNNYFAEGDIAAMKKAGFNSVRLPLDARFLLDEEPGIHFNEEQFAYLTGIIDLCEKHGLYVILDLHATSSGQSALPCDDGVDNQPHLFTDEEGEERAIILWKEMARRFADRWIIAGYDLLNEPIALPPFDHLIPNLKSFYDRVIAAIREVDKNHILLLQGSRFGGRLEIFDHNYDPVCNNWAICTHCYESMPDMMLLGPIIAKSIEMNVPVWMGETGGSSVDQDVTGNQWMATLYELLMENHISYNIWVGKGVEGCDAACHFNFKRPNKEIWGMIDDYASKGGPKPSYEKAISCFDELLENIRCENCEERFDRVAHALRRPGTTVPAIGYDGDMPKKGSWPYSIYCGYRREDGMHLVYEKDYYPCDVGGFAMMGPRPPKYGDWKHIELMLDEGDCASYSVREAEEEVSLSVTGRALGENKVQITTQTGVIYEGSLPISEENVTIKLGTLPAGERVTATIAAVKGSIVLKSVSFG